MTLADIARREPVLISGAVGALLALAIAFGAPITDKQKVALEGAAVPVVLLGAALAARSQVTPTVTSPSAGS